MGTAKMGFSMMMLEINMIMFDPDYFGTRSMALASGVASACCYLGGSVGNAFAVFLQPHTAIICTFVLSCVQVLVAVSITER